MALSTAEVARIKAELGYNLLTTANPYIGTTLLFTQIIQPYLESGTSTTSTTSVTAASTPTPIDITLADATGFSAGDRVVVDVDGRQEIVTIRSVSGSTINVSLSLAHSGTYPVSVEGAETIVREILTRIRETKSKMAEVNGTGALKSVDDVSWYDAGSKSQFGVLGENLSYWREQLASALGVRSAWSMKAAGAQTLSVY